MKRARRRYEAKPALELVEEATHLLRSAPRSALVLYYAGAIPFVLGLLFFWTDMSRSAAAYERLAGGALGTALLFFWMKIAQALFARGLRLALADGATPRLTFREVFQTFTTQSAAQATGLFGLSLAAIITLPFGWVYAFYQHLTCQAVADESEIGATVKRAMRQAALWPGQNHAALAILAGFGLCVFINWAAVCFLLPGMLHSLFGVESVFTRSGLRLLNSTFFAVVAGLTYLSVDPLVKAVYVLRCFYADSIHSGEDLKCELKSISASKDEGHAGFAHPISGRTRAAASVLVAFGLFVGLTANAAAKEQPGNAASPSVQAGTVSARELDRAIGQVIQERKYTWRLPRDTQVEAQKEKNFLTRWLESVRDWADKTAKAIGDWLDRLLRKLLGSSRAPRINPGSGYGWILAQELLLYFLIGAAALGLGYLIFKTLRDRRFSKVVETAQPLQPVPEIADESVSADQLPEDGWTQLARELMGKGELRLAMRALYFASLAHLAGRQLISLARYKSNLDYQRELRRRGHAFPQLLDHFGENVAVFDRTWYGMHEVDAPVLSRFSTNVERMRSGA
jgi:hypothetical protein